MTTASDLKIERRPEGVALLKLGGDWVLGSAVPDPGEVVARLAQEGKPQRLAFETAQLGRWNSGLLVFLTRLFQTCRHDGIGVDDSGLPEGVRKLLGLAAPENQRSGVSHGGKVPPFLERVADAAERQLKGFKDMLAFVGESTAAFGKMVVGKADFRRVDLVLTVQETGAQALGIVTLISLLVGMILAFIASIQLKMFGAQIYVADVVGIGIVRVMGAVMTGVIMSGRTGAAFAAQIGTMQVNEEIDALQTLGLSPVEYLVLPRMISLTLMMPLLCVYADLMGVFGGLLVGVGLLDLGFMEYVNETRHALSLSHFLVGLFHSFVFGVLIAISGCLRGIQCERSASAVGYAATSAVVTGIVSIVVATAVITLSCQVLGI
jgi:phospholipid/cholesterol/gamma-HCH transport system permease protein